MKRFVRTIAPRRRAVGVFHCAPGAEAQVDFFRGAPTLERATGEWRRPWVFRMTLGHSRHGYEEAVWDQKLETFLRLHERAFRDLGGVPLVVRHDNLKAAVVRACFYDPDSHDVYLAFAAHWGFTPLPTQPRTPAGKRQAGAQRRLRQGQRAQGPALRQLDAQNAFLRHWNRTIARLRIHGTTRRQVWTHFVEVEQRALQPLAADAFPLFTAGERTVHTDGHVEVGGAFYPVPLALLGQRLRVRWDAHLVRVFQGDTLVAVHARVAAGLFAPRAGEAEASTRQQAFVDRLVGQCERVGPALKQWADAALAARGRPRHSAHSGRARPHAPASARARAGRDPRGPRPPALSLSDHSPARRAHAAPAPADARHRRSGDSPHDPIHLGGLSAMNPQLTTRLRHLRLSGMVEALPGRVAQAEAAPLPHLEFLELLVEDELARRADRLFARRLKQAGIVTVKTLADFDWTFNPKIPKARLVELASARFVDTHAGVLLIGPPGVGKSHVATAIAVGAIRAGRRALVRSTFDLAADFAQAEATGARRDLVQQLTRVDLLVLEDFGMKKLGSTAAEDLLEIFVRRHETASTLITTNRPTQDWGVFLGDVPAATAILDRFLAHATIVQMTGKSYRLRQRASTADD